MCGIAGVVGGDARRVQAMLGALVHRGPDASREAAGPTAHMGCTRLAIRGGDAGAQPFSGRRGMLVFNGEIYNTAELVRELDSYGTPVDPDSDTAVVAGLLDVLGMRALDKLNGMYALAWDDGQTVWLARDPIGIKPLYYRGNSFASEIRPLLRGGGARPCEAAIARWFTFHYAYGTETCFQDVLRVPAGGIVALPEGRVVRTHDSSIRFGPPNRALNAERVRKVLERSVRDAIPDEPYGVALSGGLDSSIVAALGTDRVRAFHGRVRAEGCDESDYAREVAAFTEIDITAQACLEALPHVVRHLEEPMAGPGAMAQWVVTERASKDVRILMSGCGGDELFSGYARNAALVLDTPPPGLENYAPLFERMAGLSPGERAFAGLDRRAAHLFTQDFVDAHPAPRDEFLEAFATDDLDPLAAAARAEMALTLPALLQVEDRITMAFSVESRVPLLDRRMLRTASRLAPEQRVDSDGRLKAVLRDAAAPFLPPRVAARRDKMGFPLPLGEWFAGPWRDFTRDVLLDRRTRDRGVLDQAGVEQVLSRRDPYDRGLYAALLLELWFRTFIDHGDA